MTDATKSPKYAERRILAAIEARGRFRLPTDPAEADALAGKLGELATAAEWKRAAIVYARVRVEDKPGGDPATRAKVKIGIGDKRLTPAEFALLGIHGLKSRTTIRRYWQCWEDAITEGLAEAVTLGDEVELPDAEWADYYTPPQGHATPPYYKPERGNAALSQMLEGEVYEPHPHQNGHDEIRCQLAAVAQLDEDEEDEGLTGEVKRDWAFRGMLYDTANAVKLLDEIPGLLIGVELTPDQRVEVAKRLDEIADKIALLRASVSGESIDGG